MGKNTIITIVATECPADEEERFNQWYNNIHIPMLLKYDGLKRAGRYQLSGDSDEHARYMAIYEFESKEAQENFSNSPELAAAMEEMQGSWKEGAVTIKWMADYKQLKTWEK